MLLSMLLFFHILAACGLFCGLGLEFAAFARFRRAGTYAEARESLCHVTVVGPVMRASVLVLLAAGIWMVYEGFGWTPWVITVLVMTVGMAVLGGAVNGKRLEAAHGQCASGEGALPQTVLAVRADGLLNFTEALVPCVLVAAVFLMTVKPELPTCIGAVAAALLVATVLGRSWIARLGQASAAIPQ